jgi:hypothetical protein
VGLTFDDCWHFHTMDLTRQGCYRRRALVLASAARPWTSSINPWPILTTRESLTSVRRIDLLFFVLMVYCQLQIRTVPIILGRPMSLPGRRNAVRWRWTRSSSTTTTGCNINERACTKCDMSFSHGKVKATDETNERTGLLACNAAARCRCASSSASKTRPQLYRAV